ncbi:MAG: methyltransferase domain-containing protein [Campylobacterota bacterium]|nr:methyltransferase domain-containing protein [Campylobacterota bacterium]
MSAQNEFSRYADHYGDYNVIQKQVAAKLVEDLNGEEPARLLDLGCGNGALFQTLPYLPTHFLGIDFAPRMLELHPKGANIECIYGDFNDPNLFDHLHLLQFDRIFSASALQWSVDLRSVFLSIASLKTPVSLAIFTENTFATLFKTAGLTPLLRSSDEVAALAKNCFNADAHTVHYKLAFDSVREMFRYIKKSGVSGGRNALSYKQTKTLMETYPLDYLEFEVVFIQT